MVAQVTEHTVRVKLGLGTLSLPPLQTNRLQHMTGSCKNVANTAQCQFQFAKQPRRKQTAYFLKNNLLYKCACTCNYTYHTMYNTKIIFTSAVMDLNWSNPSPVRRHQQANELCIALCSKIYIWTEQRTIHIILLRHDILRYQNNVIQHEHLYCFSSGSGMKDRIYYFYPGNRSFQT